MACGVVAGLAAGRRKWCRVAAGAAKVDITDERGLVNDRLYVRALALKSGGTTAVLVSMDAVAIGGIGRIKDDFLPRVRTTLKKELGIPPEHTLFNASHCHGLVHPETEARTVAAVQQAIKNLEPVQAGSGVGRETRIMENRRLILKNGKTVDVRHAYSLPPNDQVASVGPVDPQIGCYGWIVWMADRWRWCTILPVIRLPIRRTAEILRILPVCFPDDRGESRQELCGVVCAGCRGGYQPD